MRTSFAFVLSVALALIAAPAFAEDGPAAPAREIDHHAALEAHGNAHGATGAHGDAHGGHHVPTFHDINWFYGLLGEKDDVEPNLLFRPTGMPAPFGAWILNAALLYYVLYRFARKPVAGALKNRKASILKGMNEASRMRDDAEARLSDYEAKLERIEDDIERVKTEMREASRIEREKVLAEARARRERMERDARLLVEQELAATRELMKRELVTQALASAAETLKKRLSDEDGRRLADEYLSGLKAAGSSLRGRA
jgi:F-type H+-transporting ATPase subunit b